MRISDWSSDVCSSDLVAARARLPVEASESAEIVAFRSPEEASDHVALIIGRRDANPPVVRLHSECLTGDVLGSLKCDCGPQLHAALHAMADARWGVLLYLRPEGRGDSSAERRVGKEGVGTCRSGWSPKK